MDDEIRINRIQPYPASNDGGGRRPREGQEEEPQEGDTPPEEEPEVKDGKIDTRVAPPPSALGFC